MYGVWTSISTSARANLPLASSSYWRSRVHCGSAPASSFSMSRLRGSNRGRSASCSTTCMRMKHNGVTFFFISHHLQEIYEICERVAVMRDGRLVKEAAVGDLDQNAVVAAMVGEALYGGASERGSRERTTRGGSHRRSDVVDSRPVVLDLDSVISGQHRPQRIASGEKGGTGGLGRSRRLGKVGTRTGDRGTARGRRRGGVAVNGRTAADRSRRSRARVRYCATCRRIATPVASAPISR